MKVLILIAVAVLVVGAVVVFAMTRRATKQNAGSATPDAIVTERETALRGLFGKADTIVYHSPVPLYLGGDADVLSFSSHLNGVVFVTSDLIGDESQKPNSQGHYELMIALREKSDWAPNLVSKLANVTFDEILNPGETMDIGPALPNPSTLTAFLFVDYGRINVAKKECGVLCCIGITADELSYCMAHGPSVVLEKLKSKGIYPFTDLDRGSVLAEPVAGSLRIEDGKSLDSLRFDIIDDYLTNWNLFAQGRNDLVQVLKRDQNGFSKELAKALRAGDRRAPSRMVFAAVVQVGGAISADGEVGTAAKPLLTGVRITDDKGKKVYSAGDLYHWWVANGHRFDSFPLFESWLQTDFAKKTVIPTYERLQ